MNDCAAHVPLALGLPRALPPRAAAALSEKIGRQKEKPRVFLFEFPSRAPAARLRLGAAACAPARAARKGLCFITRRVIVHTSL